jgi:hypothetical protein
MSNLIIEKLLAKTNRTDLPDFHPGDTVRVHVKIKEGDKERVQAFEGVVIKRDRGPQASFTVRKAWSAFFQSIPGSSTKSIWCAHLRFAGRNCTICAVCAAKPLACATWKRRSGPKRLIRSSPVSQRRRDRGQTTGVLLRKILKHNLLLKDFLRSTKMMVKGFSCRHRSQHRPRAHSRLPRPSCVC